MSPRRRYTRRQLMVALSAGVAAAAVTVGLVLTLAGGQKAKPHHRPSPVASAPGTTGQPRNSGGGSLNNRPPQTCQQTQSGCSQTTLIPTVVGPSADWMGMQIVTSPSGVVVSTVKLGSPADEAGFEPGDQIKSLDGHIIGSVTELKTDTDGLRIGAPVTIDVWRASVQLTFASIHMTQRPTIHP